MGSTMDCSLYRQSRGTISGNYAMGWRYRPGTVDGFTNNFDVAVTAALATGPGGTFSGEGEWDVVMSGLAPDQPMNGTFAADANNPGRLRGLFSVARSDCRRPIIRSTIRMLVMLRWTPRWPMDFWSNRTCLNSDNELRGTSRNWLVPFSKSASGLYVRYLRNACLAASIVLEMSSSEWAVLRNAASNCDGGR